MRFGFGFRLGLGLGFDLAREVHGARFWRAVHRQHGAAIEQRVPPARQRAVGGKQEGGGSGQVVCSEAERQRAASSEQPVASE